MWAKSNEGLDTATSYISFPPLITAGCFENAHFHFPEDVVTFKVESISKRVGLFTDLDTLVAI